MWVYIARRLLWLPVLLSLVSFITFFLGGIAPGDPTEVILGNNWSVERAERLREQLGLDKPLIVQYRNYMWNAVRGDLGESFVLAKNRPVSELIASKMWVSAQLGIAATIISVGFGLPLGFFIAHKQGRWQDPSTVTMALFLMSIPVMIAAPFLLWVFCLKWGVLPCSGWGGFFNTRIVIPALVMGVPGIAGFTRLMRASTLDVMGQDFIRTAYSKGLSQIVVDSRHILKNAMIPIITIMGFVLAGLIGGAFITETILGIPGAGRLAVDSIFARDYPIIMAITLIASTAFVLANLVADILYSIIDPRIRYS